MTTQTETKSLTIRLQSDLYKAAVRVARLRGRSLNALVQQGVEEIVRQQDEAELSAAFDLLSHYPDECDVEYAVAAQAEVALRDE